MATGTTRSGAGGPKNAMDVYWMRGGVATHHIKHTWPWEVTIARTWDLLSVNRGVNLTLKK